VTNRDILKASRKFRDPGTIRKLKFPVRVLLNLFN
jgi:hypothetical protein